MSLGDFSLALLQGVKVCTYSNEGGRRITVSIKPRVLSYLYESFIEKLHLSLTVPLGPGRLEASALLPRYLGY